jgi:type I restriction enzyme, R subunit
MSPVNYSDKKTEHDMRTRYIDPALYHDSDGAQWDFELVDHEHPYNDGPIIPDGRGGKRGDTDIPDYVLRANKTLRLAIIEAKNFDKTFKDGMQQGMEYAEDLDCNFVYSTNGIAINKEKNQGIYEYDYVTKKFSERGDFPSLGELLERDPRTKLEKSKSELFLKPLSNESSTFGKPLKLRYYQANAVNRTFSAILEGKKKMLLALATGTGKTQIAFQIARKFWNDTDEKGNHPKILFLTDRVKLLTQAMDGDFKPFGDARHRLQGKEQKQFDMYFTLYQSLGADKIDEISKEDSQLYKLYPKNFFQMIIIDECHRGASTEGGEWRDILKYFDGAIHMGMTATPKIETENKDTYDFFGKPVYTYSKNKATKDGFLAATKLVRIIPSIDIEGYTPEPGKTGRDGEPLEERTYTVEEFDKKITIPSRQEEVAKEILDFLNTPPYDKNDKTIMFCTDQQHAQEMTELLVNLSGEGTKYCKRITSDEGDTGKAELDKFCNVKEKYPVIAVTSELMSTGVNAPSCKLIVLDKFVDSMVQLKQIDGRGTRVHEETDKFWYTVLDFRGSTEQYSDPMWDGEPIITPKGPGVGGTSKPPPKPPVDPKESVKRIVIDGVDVEIVGKIFTFYDPNAPNGKRIVKLREVAGRLVRQFESNASGEKLRQTWADPEKRQSFIKELERNGISIQEIRQDSNLYQTDIFDILMNYAYNSQAVTRRYRVEKVKKNQAFFKKYSETAKDVLRILLEHYAEVGYQELDDNEFLQLEKFEKFDGPANIVNEIFEGKFEQIKKEILQLIYEK